MNFFHSLFKSKLDAMRAAAPRATIHLLHESNGFAVYLDEAAAVRKVCQLGTVEDKADDILDDSVLHLFIPFEQTTKFIEEVTAHYSVALVDVVLATKVNASRYVMYAYFAKRGPASIGEAFINGRDLPPYVIMAGASLREQVIDNRVASLCGDPSPTKEKEPDDDFWG